MIDLSPLVRRLAGTPLASWSHGLQAQLEAKLEKGHGDLDRWRGALDALPMFKLLDRMGLGRSGRQAVRQALLPRVAKAAGQQAKDRREPPGSLHRGLAQEVARAEAICPRS